MPKPIAALLAAVLLAAAGPALATEPGSAKGTVTVGDQATPLTHVYAWEETDIPEMRLGDSPERRIVLLVLDRPLPANARADMGSAVQLAIKGELRGIYLDLDAAERRAAGAARGESEQLHHPRRWLRRRGGEFPLRRRQARAREPQREAARSL